MNARLPRRRLAGLATLAACAWMLWACAQTFLPSNDVNSVRILAIRADPPYATPGATVSLDLLAVDGRASKPAPMSVGWIAAPCVNPAGDAYYNCFPSFASRFEAGVDLTGELTPGATFSFQLPADVIASHAATTGGDPYGVAVVFAMACGGHVQYTPPRPGGSPDAVPFGCFDASGEALGASDFVFAYATVYSFADRTNANPVIDHLTFGGSTVDIDAGIAMSRCTNSTVTNCPTTPVDTNVPASSQEADPGTLDANGNALKEEIWVDYYVTGTQLENDTEVLYDPVTGALSGTGDGMYAPQTAGAQELWAVVHDNRGGVSWLAVPVTAK